MRGYIENNEDYVTLKTLSNHIDNNYDCTSILNKYSQYNLIPTKGIRWVNSVSIIRRVITIALSVAFVILSICVLDLSICVPYSVASTKGETLWYCKDLFLDICDMYRSSDNKSDAIHRYYIHIITYSDYFLFYPAFLAVSLILYLIHQNHKRYFYFLKKHPEVDYIQKLANKRFYFVCSDGMLGIADIRNCSITVPTVYDSLIWKKYGLFLKATEGKKSYMIDINGNLLV